MVSANVSFLERFKLFKFNSIGIPFSSYIAVIKDNLVLVDGFSKTKPIFFLLSTFELFSSWFQAGSYSHRYSNRHIRVYAKSYNVLRVENGTARKLF